MIRHSAPEKASQTPLARVLTATSSYRLGGDWGRTASGTWPSGDSISSLPSDLAA